MTKIESWRDIPTDLGIFRLAVDTSGAVHAGWHHVGDAPAGGAKDPRLRDDLASWVEDLILGQARPVPRFNIPQGPVFFRQCWEACRTVPAGQLLSYRQLASLAGRPGAARAAGAAMRHNPTPLLVPCHRIVRTGGNIGGFAGRTSPSDHALRLKRELLELEGCHIDPAAPQGILCYS